MVITLTPEIENALLEAARRQGTTPECLALDSLRERFVHSAETEAPIEGGTLADFLADPIEVLDSSEVVPSGARMSEDTGRKFAEGLIRKSKFILHPL